MTLVERFKRSVGLPKTIRIETPRETIEVQASSVNIEIDPEPYWRSGDEDSVGYTEKSATFIFKTERPEELSNSE